MIPTDNDKKKKGKLISNKKNTSNTVTTKSGSAAFNAPKQMETEVVYTGKNIIKFPKKAKPRPGTVHEFRNGKTFPVEGLPEEMLKWRTEQKHKFVEHLVSEAFEGISIQFIENYMFPSDNKNEIFDQDMHVLLEVIRAVFYRQFDLEHSFHEYMNTAKKEIDPETGKEFWVVGGNDEVEENVEDSN